MYSGRELTKEGIMITGKSQFLQLTVSAITFGLVVGALSMIWPAIIALFLGVLWLLQSFNAEQEMVVVSWREVENASIVFASLRRSDLPAILS
jgi:ascorbate-specific PTS system EIIC-type component UlaA